MSDATNYAILPPDVAQALETLFQAVQRADAAFAAVASRIGDEGKVQRLGEGAWAVLTTRASEPSSEDGNHG